MPGEPERACRAHGGHALKAGKDPLRLLRVPLPLGRDVLRRPRPVTGAARWADPPLIERSGNERDLVRPRAGVLRVRLVGRHQSLTTVALVVVSVPGAVKVTVGGGPHNSACRVSWLFSPSATDASVTRSLSPAPRTMSFPSTIP